jgi:hypothetical protein
MKKLLIGVMACYALTARAQVQESKNFIYFFSDSVQYAKNIKLRPDFLGYLQLRADSRKVPTGQVKFFSNEDGFFANTRKLDFVAGASFSERIIEGKINVYQQERYDPEIYDGRYRRNRYMERERPTVDVRMFYNKGYGDLKKANYRNLSRDMADHQESMDLLKSYRKSMNSSKVMYVAAGASFVAGVVSFIASAGGKTSMPDRKGFGANFGSSIKETNFTPGFILLGAGLGFGLGGVAIQRSGTRHLENAIERYNR